MPAVAESLVCRARCQQSPWPMSLVVVAAAGILREPRASIGGRRRRASGTTNTHSPKMTLECLLVLETMFQQLFYYIDYHEV
jgi:hypothetical protein